MLVVGAIGGPVSGLILWLFLFLVPLLPIAIGIRRFQFSRKIADLPTSKIRSISTGLVEIKGKLDMDGVVSPISGTRCKFWQLETNSIGFEDPYIRSSSKTLKLNDGSGCVLVKAADAEIRLEPTLDITLDLSDTSKPKTDNEKRAYRYFQNRLKRKYGKALSVDFRECCITSEKEVYVIGDAGHSKKKSLEPELTIEKGWPDRILFISDSPETRIVSGIQKESLMYVGLGLVLAFLFTYAMFDSLVDLFSTDTTDFQSDLGVGVILLGILIGLAIHFQGVYNDLIYMKNDIEKKWADIDAYLKLRYDLIPNLVNTVKGYMKHEKTLLEEITRLRVSMMQTESLSSKAKASEDISKTLKTIFAVAENYPKLEASKNFLKLQEQLTAIENQIADRREFYNNAVLHYNTRIHSFPDMVFALLLRFKEKEYFKATEEKKKNVKIES